MDINMRGTNGIEATAQFKQAFPRIAVLILSMHDKLEYVSQAIQAGARGYVLKDAPGKDIVVAIETVMSASITAPRWRASWPSRSPGQPADHARARGAAPHRQWRVDKQIARALDLSVRTVETPPQHQAQAGHRRAGRTDPLCRAARAGGNT
jgi:DNA-binding NarL/FixJ family response regulator